MFGGLELTKKKMGGMGKLSQFSGIKRAESEPTTPSAETAEESKVEEAGAEVVRQREMSVEEKPSARKNQEKLVTVNIKITKSQKDWLAETASQVRDNNDEPVPPAERVYPQHLIGTAIELLRAAEVDWNQVQNVEELRERLNL
jgi:hypothetical protein